MEKNRDPIEQYTDLNEKCERVKEKENHFFTDGFVYQFYYYFYMFIVIVKAI